MLTPSFKPPDATAQIFSPTHACVCVCVCRDHHVGEGERVGQLQLLRLISQDSEENVDSAVCVTQVAVIADMLYCNETDCVTIYLVSSLVRRRTRRA